MLTFKYCFFCCVVSSRGRHPRAGGVGWGGRCVEGGGGGGGWSCVWVGVSEWVCRWDRCHLRQVFLVLQYVRLCAVRS